ncbi:MAG: ribose 5-phosphate isomerase A [Alkalispirochaeta sp.]
MDTTTVKQELGYTLVERFVRSGMKIGLGTGSTAIHAVRRVGQLIQDGTLTDVVAVPTSFETTIEAQTFGIPLRSMNDPDIAGGLDLAIDGADEVDTRDLSLIKGGGGALTREKVVEYRAKTLYVIVDESKLSKRLGSGYPVPVECIPDALKPVERELAAFGCRPVLRMAVRKAGPVVTDNGNLILDLHFDDPSFDPATLEIELNRVPGVLENGIFTGVSRRIFVGRADGTIEEVLAGE